MQISRALVRPAAALAAALSLVFTAPVAVAVAGEALAPTLTSDVAIITAGETVTLSGVAAPDATVSLFAFAKPSTTYVLDSTTTAAADGAFNFVLQPLAFTRFYVSDGTATSSVVTVPVRVAVTLDDVTTDGDAGLVSGSLFPVAVGSQVDIVLTRDGVREIVATTYTGRTGRFFAGFGSSKPGAYLLSAAAHQTRTNVPGESAAQQVVMTPAAAGARPS